MSNSRFGFRSRKGEIRSFIEGNLAFPNDVDAQAFIDAAGITATTQQSAINTLVVSLKNNSIWTKFNAIYPFVGGTATTHMYNLRDPRNLDAAFRLVFTGGWTHSSNGATPNGTNAFANTFIVPSTNLSQNNISMGLYSGTDVLSATVAIGVQSAGPSNLLRIYPRHPGNLFFADLNDSSLTAGSNSNGRGFLFGSRRLSNQKRISIRGTLSTLTENSTGMSTFSIYLGAANSAGTPSLYSPFEHRLSFVGEGLTDIEAGNFYTAVQAFQTTLGRQV